jgi:hypothetical protein
MDDDRVKRTSIEERRDKFGLVVAVVIEVLFWIVLLFLISPSL